jgi:protein tyrosine phosphatase (PTP) superfamily phosphohydrolase (DUF442 family)
MRRLENAEEFKLSTLGSFVAVVMYRLPGCSVCDRSYPLYAEFPAVFPSAVWCVTESAAVATQEGVEAFPTYDVYRRGKKTVRMTGGDELASLQEAVREMLRGQVLPLTEEVLLLDWQPPAEQLPLLKRQTGARTLVNLRHPSEKGYVSAQAEAAAAGIEHAAEVGIVDVQDITTEYLRQACGAIDEAEKPAVVHCLVGLTAVLVACVNEAKRRGLGVHEVGKWMADLGPFNLASMARVMAVVDEYLKSDQTPKKDKKGKKDKKDKKKDKKKSSDGDEKKKKKKKDKKKKDGKAKKDKK